MTLLEALKCRHSVRNYIDRPIESGTAQALRDEIRQLNAASGLDMQLVTGEPYAFRSVLAYGMFRNVTNYIVVAGRKSGTLDYKAGYYIERMVLFARSIGLDTCIVGLTYRKVGEAFAIGPDEKVVVCVAIGYGADNGRKHRIKSPEQVSNISDATPGWFARGVEAALLAPTAVNQQKFYFEYVAPAAGGGMAGVIARRGRSIAGYTKIDLGIAMCNFEIGAGTENFEWIDSPL